MKRCLLLLVASGALLVSPLLLTGCKNPDATNMDAAPPPAAGAQPAENLAGKKKTAGPAGGPMGGGGAVAPTARRGNQ